MDVSGTVKKIGSTEEINDSFRKREIVITTKDKYPQILLFQFTQDRCDLLHAASAGDEVKIHFNLRGREWTSPTGEVKVFNTLEGWKLEMAKEGAATHNPEAQSESAKSDLPF